jgi:hypothetical protein
MSMVNIIFTAEFFAGLVSVFAISYFIGWLLRLENKQKADHKSENLYRR